MTQTMYHQQEADKIHLQWKRVNVLSWSGAGADTIQWNPVPGILVYNILSTKL
jgi:hypothetical protein